MIPIIPPTKAEEKILIEQIVKRLLIEVLKTRTEKGEMFIFK